MRNSTRIFGALAVAALATAGGSAFTNSNTGVEAANVGYESAAVSGVAVTNVEYVVDTGNASLLSSIVFQETQDVSTHHVATLTINGPTSIGADRITCDTTVANTITCLTSHDIATVTSIALTVAQITS